MGQGHRDGKGGTRVGTEGQGDEGTGLGTEGEGHGDRDTGTRGQRDMGMWGHRATRMGTQEHKDRGIDRTWG